MTTTHRVEWRKTARPMTLVELDDFVTRAAAAGIAGDALVEVRATFKGNIRSLAMSGGDDVPSTPPADRPATHG